MRARSSLRLVVIAGLLTSFAAACGEEFVATPGTTASGTGATGGGTSSGGAGGSGGSGAGGSTSSTGGGGGNPCPDEDGDGVTTCAGDCNDKDPTTYKGALDVCGDGIDNDCAGGPDDTCPNGLGTYVSNGGSDLDPGTQKMPVATIKQGIANALTLGNGQPVFVSGGHYSAKVDLVEGVSIYGGYEPVTWIHDPANNDTAILCQDATGVEADNTITRATVLDGFRLQGASNINNGQIGGTLTIVGGAPTISNNVINAPSQPGAGISSYAVLVLAPTDAAGPLIESNRINGSAAMENSIGIVLASPIWPPPSPGANAEIRGNNIVAGIGLRSHGIEVWAGGNGVVISGNQVTAGSSNGSDSWGMVLAGSPLLASFVVERNAVNVDQNSVGTCSGAISNTNAWCGGINSVAMKGSITNNFVYGVKGKSSTALWLHNPEQAPQSISVSSNFLDGGGVNAPGNLSAAIVLTVNQGTNTVVGRIRNNILSGGSALLRAVVYEDSALGKTCHPEALENNDFFFAGVVQAGDILYRFWDGNGQSFFTMIGQVNTQVLMAANNFTGDPVIDGTGHLKAGSPCIDKGTPTEAPPKDFEGEGRPKGAGYDVGPDEK